MPGHAIRDRRLPGIGRSRSGSSGGLRSKLSLSLNFENAANLGLDGTGQNNLTNNGVVAQGAGKVGSGSAAYVNVTQSLSHADTASLQIGSGDLTITFWLNPNPTGGQPETVVAKWSDASPEYEFAWNHFSSVWNWRVGLTSAANQVQISSVVLPFSVWSWVELTWVAATATAGVTINNGTPALTVGTSVSPATANPFLLGGNDGGVIGGNMTGLIDNFNLWQRQLTPAERAFLASGAPGTEYPF